MSVFEGCSDSCGWAAAVIALFAAGTFGVPIKETHSMPNLNPLIFQSFKTAVFFLESLCFIKLANVPCCTYTPWGLLSGLLWVLGGTGGIVAVRLAGLAVAVGTWASVMICVNFVWGILIFQEPVANIKSTVAAFILLGLGLTGMSKFGAPPCRSSDAASAADLNRSSHSVMSNSKCDLDDSDDKREENDDDNTAPERVRLLVRSHSGVFRRTGVKSEESAEVVLDTASKTELPAAFEIDTAFLLLFNPETHVRVFGVILRKRVAGILAAFFNGIMSGSALIPMHYAKRHGLGGANYMISYATGAVFANASIWIIYYAVLVMQMRRNSCQSWMKNLLQAADNMPEWHFQKLWKTGLAAGTLSQFRRGRTTLFVFF